MLFIIKGMLLKNRTERLFYDYTSANPFSAGILELRPGNDGTTQVILDKTIFYPEGGGQPADRGMINGVPLLDVQEKNGEIVHLVKDTNVLGEGSAELILDYRRRRDLTQLHTGQHLLSSVILRMTGAPTVSMHLGDETCTIDVNTPEMSGETILAVEDAVAGVIEENRPVIIHFCPPEDISSFPLRKVPPGGEEIIRVVEIEGCDFVACCGTHLKTTAEIGLLRVLSAEKYKGMTRVSFLAGHRLLLDSRSLRQNAVIVSRALSVPINETGKGILEFLEKSTQIEKRLKTFSEKAVKEKTEVLLKKAGEKDSSEPVTIIESYAEEDINEVLNIGKAAQKQCPAVFILASEQSLKFAAYSSVKDFDLRVFLKGELEKQGGRGGGGSAFFQGSFGSKEAMNAFLSRLAAGGFSGGHLSD